MENSSRNSSTSDRRMTEMGEFRRRIDAIDDQILELINQRLMNAGKIGEIKNRSGAPVVDSLRESRIYQRLSSLNRGPLREAALHHIFRAVIAAGRGVQNPACRSGVAPLYAVFGNPVSHSLSPAMHSSALAHAGLDGVYLAFRVENIAMAVKGIRGLNIRGASITIPHKISVMQYLDELDSTASDIGAVNTIINRKGVLHGYNSDGEGAVKALLEKTTIKGKQVTVIGAGGAARAIAFGIQQEGGRLTIINRSKQAGEKLADDLSCEFKLLADVKKLSCQILINATPAGMTPDINTHPLAPGLVQPGMVVMDMVYNPLKTRFLEAAELIGCATVDGVAMFVHQGAVQFELWTSQKPPLDIMRKAVVEELKI